MLAAHYSTAMLACQRFPRGTLTYFLIASQLQDLLWLSFHYLGLEPTLPEDLMNVTLQGLKVDMQYSHDLLPQVFWMLVTYGVGRLVFKSNSIGIAGSLLVLGHFILDVLSGFPHHIFGPHTHDVGLSLYVSNVYLAIGIEAVFVTLVLWYFFRSEEKLGRKRTPGNKRAIIGLFAFGVLFLLFVAKTSFRNWFGIPDFALAFNTSIPVLILTYVGMIFYLHYFIARHQA